MENQNSERGHVAPATPCSVWIVVGETGQYSDYSEWNVAAFTTEELADHFRDLCQNEADKVNGSKDYEIRDGFKSAYDTQFYCAYNGTRYRVAMVEVFSSSPPNVKEHATLSAGASVDHWVEVGITGEHVNRAADRGCSVSTCSACLIL